MGIREKKFFFLLLVCCISFEGCAGKVSVPQKITFWVEDHSAALSCQVTDITPSRVFWRSREELPTWDENGIKLPNQNEKYDMITDNHENFVLIIKNISISDAQIYTCVARGGDEKAQFDTSQVTVNDAPIEPYLTIDDCHGENDGEHDCHIDVFNGTETRNLTCRVKHFFPNVTIMWSSRGVVIEPLDVEWRLNEDGTYSGGVTIRTSPQDEAYVCTATGEALRNVGTMSVEVVVQVHEGSDEDGNSSYTGLIVGIVIAVLFILMFVLFIFYVLWVKRREGGGKFNYKYTKQKAGGGTVAEDDERRAGAGKSTTGKSSHKPDEQDNFRISEEIEIEEEETFGKSEKSPKSKDSHRYGGFGYDLSYPSSCGGGGGGGHDYSHSYSSGGGGGGGWSHHDDHGGSDD